MGALWREIYDEARWSRCLLYLASQPQPSIQSGRTALALARVPARLARVPAVRAIL